MEKFGQYMRGDDEWEMVMDLIRSSLICDRDAEKIPFTGPI